MQQCSLHIIIHEKYVRAQEGTAILIEVTRDWVPKSALAVKLTCIYLLSIVIRQEPNLLYQLNSVFGIEIIQQIKLK